MGYCSRSAASRLIEEGQVQVNGEVVCDPNARFRPDKDRVTIDGKAIKKSLSIYLMLNKPRGIVTSARDEKGRQTVYSLLPEHQNWVSPVGRLDKASEGLLLLTNDSAWAARITSPESHLAKTYHVQIDTIADDGVLSLLAEGVMENGELLKAKRVRTLRQGQKTCWLEIVLDEGKNRHIRRMLATHKIQVLRLIRVAIGPLKLGDLAKGRTRELTSQEVRSLNREMA